MVRGDEGNSPAALIALFENVLEILVIVRNAK